MRMMAGSTPWLRWRRKDSASGPEQFWSALIQVNRRMRTPRMI